ncbi:hypothetical protein BDN72DRAFT_893671 [Pluteus cervinus]|uniref:Uncharacterized protein n=1 Tax=Pluteus cervinus TaxID=181527 RepID=A0ACD3B714_9AGAR|nr:hypothetical protein BDN72DRAFT_893671 [Pluteus cervinus]
MSVLTPPLLGDDNNNGHGRVEGTPIQSAYFNQTAEQPAYQSLSSMSSARPNRHSVHFDRDDRTSFTGRPSPIPNDSSVPSNVPPPHQPRDDETGVSRSSMSGSVQQHQLLQPGAYFPNHSVSRPTHPQFYPPRNVVGQEPSDRPPPSRSTSLLTEQRWSSTETVYTTYGPAEGQSLSSHQRPKKTRSSALVPGRSPVEIRAIEADENITKWAIGSLLAFSVLAFVVTCFTDKSR